MTLRSKEEQNELDDRLFTAISDDEWDIAKRVIGEGANANAVSEFGETPLHSALYHGDSESTIRLLLEKGADVNARSDGDQGKTPLHIACGYQSPSVVRLLLGYGADVNASDNHGNLAIHLAILGYNYDTAFFLLCNGADPMMRNFNGASPLDLVASSQNGEEDMEIRRARERIIDWYREHHPELVMERYCARERYGPGRT